MPLLIEYQQEFEQIEITPEFIDKSSEQAVKILILQTQIIKAASFLKDEISKIPLIEQTDIQQSKASNELIKKGLECYQSVVMCIRTWLLEKLGFDQKQLLALVRDAEVMQQILSKIEHNNEIKPEEKESLALDLFHLYTLSVDRFKKLAQANIDFDQRWKRSKRTRNIVFMLFPLLQAGLILLNILFLPQITTIAVLKLVAIAIITVLCMEILFILIGAFAKIGHAPCGDMISFREALFKVKTPDYLIQPNFLSWKPEDLQKHDEKIVTHDELKTTKVKLKQLLTETSATTTSKQVTEEHKMPLLDSPSSSQATKTLFFKTDGRIRKIRSEKLCFGTQAQYQRQQLLFKSSQLMRDTAVDHTAELTSLAQQYAAAR